MENRYGVSPMTMLQLLEPMIVILPILLWLLVIGPLLLYPFARWKAHREPHVDTQLGLKVALHYFRLLGFQLLLLGGLVILWTIIRKGGDKGDSYRGGFGLLVPGALIFGAHVALLKRTTDEMLVTVRRLFMGYNLLVTGLFATVALVLGFEALFARGSSDEGRLFLAAVLIYVTAWVACGARFAILVGADLTSAAPPQQNAAPPGPPAGPSLPALGGGSYPPISQT